MQPYFTGAAPVTDEHGAGIAASGPLKSRSSRSVSRGPSVRLNYGYHPRYPGTAKSRRAAPTGLAALSLLGSECPRLARRDLLQCRARLVANGA